MLKVVRGCISVQQVYNMLGSISLTGERLDSNQRWLSYSLVILPAPIGAKQLTGSSSRHISLPFFQSEGFSISAILDSTGVDFSKKAFTTDFQIKLIKMLFRKQTFFSLTVEATTK